MCNLYVGSKLDIEKSAALQVIGAYMSKAILTLLMKCSSGLKILHFTISSPGLC